ncbi:MAG: hypothetical protein GXO88_10520 [Chlorobi bacterium]|nr:hypothetical protein [Chlorobiota bacterium]
MLYIHKRLTIKKRGETEELNLEPVAKKVRHKNLILFVFVVFSLNFTGFPALAGGHRYFKDCSFNSIGVIGFWWTATKEDVYNAWYQAVHFGYSQVGKDNGGMNTGMSIRCIKN